MEEAICKKCGKKEFLKYKTAWFRKNKGTGNCRSCSNIGGNSGSFKKGEISWNKGITGENSHSYGKIREGLWGEDNPAWKGDDCSYVALHQWVYRKLGKARDCEYCGYVGKCQWANISREYRRDIDDFISLCCSCHRYYDLGKLDL